MCSSECDTGDGCNSRARTCPAREKDVVAAHGRLEDDCLFRVERQLVLERARAHALHLLAENGVAMAGEHVQQLKDVHKEIVVVEAEPLVWHRAH